MNAALRRVGFVLLFALFALVGFAVYNFNTVCRGQCNYGNADCVERCHSHHYCPANRGCE